jgi:tetratricopeptide (TPR) repeat protein
MKERMKNFLLIICILIVANPVFADEAVQQALIKQGFNYTDAAHYRDAINVFKKVLDENPENPEAYYGLGISYLGLGDTVTATIPQLVQDAIYSLKKALNFGATHPEIYYSLGICYLALKDKELAIKQYDILEGLNWDLADRLLDKIVAFERLQEDTGPNVQEKVIPLKEEN